MVGKNVTFVGPLSQENLGLGYLTSILKKRGYEVSIFDFEDDVQSLSYRVVNTDPLLVGISFLFQFHFKYIQNLAILLRKAGLQSHLTTGGHFPSLRYEQTLKEIPELDSIVMFEGDITIGELVDSLSTSANWRAIDGIVYLENGVIFVNKPRRLVENLDELPYPHRIDFDRFNCVGLRFAHITASRGCTHNCSFCSIRKFYSIPEGPSRRGRSPRSVFGEIKSLLKHYGVSVFIFQDDDFLSTPELSRSWVQDFISLLEKERLDNHLVWKISCRSDEVEKTLFHQMFHAGLRFVFLGIESGNIDGLRMMRKNLSPDDHIRAVQILKDLDIFYEFGFMMFHPWTTFSSVKEDLTFLNNLCSDGSSPVVLGRMVPFAGTWVEKELINSGRLKGTVEQPNYEFLEDGMNSFFNTLHDIFSDWMSLSNGLLVNLRWTRFQIGLLSRFYPEHEDVRQLKTGIQQVVAKSNVYFFDTVNSLLRLYHDNPSDCVTGVERIKAESKIAISHFEEMRLEELSKFEIAQ